MAENKLQRNYRFKSNRSGERKAMRIAIIASVLIMVLLIIYMEYWSKK